MTTDHRRRYTGRGYHRDQYAIAAKKPFRTAFLASIGWGIADAFATILKLAIIGATLAAVLYTLSRLIP